MNGFLSGLLGGVAGYAAGKQNNQMLGDAVANYGKQPTIGDNWAQAAANRAAVGNFFGNLFGQQGQSVTDGSQPYSSQPSAYDGA